MTLLLSGHNLSQALLFLAGPPTLKSNNITCLGRLRRMPFLLFPSQSPVRRPSRCSGVPAALQVSVALITTISSHLITTCLIRFQGSEERLGLQIAIRSESHLSVEQEKSKRKIVEFRQAHARRYSNSHSSLRGFVYHSRFPGEISYGRLPFEGNGFSGLCHSQVHNLDFPNRCVCGINMKWTTQDDSYG